MHGLINRAIECFVCDTYGAEVWGEIVRRAGLDFVEFEAMLNYDAELTLDVLDALAAVLDRPLHDSLEDIGTYLVTGADTGALRRLLRFGGANFTEFLHSLDELPGRARLAVAELDLPRIELREHATNQFSLICLPGLVGFGHVLLGVLRAMADDYGALAFLEHQGSRDGVETIAISVVEGQFTDGRAFSLGQAGI